MGKKVGLSPVWVILALYVGGATMGVLGVLISIPVASVLDVLIRHALRSYFASNYYSLETSSPQKNTKKK
jgi:predicted PurR-regulated permease PerM